ncbi:hypothetical protein H2684_03735 [Clostridium sp. cel8]|nr:hypothetical protein [Clostridium sp. cel8]
MKYKNDDEIKNKIKLCNKMNSSYENFINGMDFFNKKDYLNAYNDLKQVIPEDKKRYDKARDKGNESLTLYINNQITEAKNLAYKLQYQH